MKLHPTPIAAAVAMTLLSMAAAHAQSADKPADASLGTVKVTGIRASLEQSLTKKRNAESIVEVVTAEDIGKMPDKNVADSLAHVPGVTTTSAVTAAKAVARAPSAPRASALRVSQPRMFRPSAVRGWRNGCRRRPRNSRS